VTRWLIGRDKTQGGLWSLGLILNSSTAIEGSEIKRLVPGALGSCEAVLRLGLLAIALFDYATYEELLKAIHRWQI